MKFIIFTSLIIFLIFPNSSSADCSISGKTWDNSGELSVIPNIVKHEKCIELCLDTNDCKGYTWFGLNKQRISTRLSEICILYKELEGQHECKNCISGYAEECLCNQKNAECKISGDNFLRGQFADSVADCFLQCSQLPECKFYTWFSDKNENTHNLCLLFANCDEVTECKSGCVTGK